MLAEGGDGPKPILKCKPGRPYGMVEETGEGRAGGQWEDDGRATAGGNGGMGMGWVMGGGRGAGNLFVVLWVMGRVVGRGCGPSAWCVVVRPGQAQAGGQRRAGSGRESTGGIGRRLAGSRSSRLWDTQRRRRRHAKPAKSRPKGKNRRGGAGQRRMDERDLAENQPSFSHQKPRRIS
jgi:hypothetical protein